MRFCAVLLFLLASTAAGWAQEKLPVEARLIANKTTYKLDLGGKTAAEMKQLFKRAAKDGTDLPRPPAVDLVLEIVNTSEKAVRIWQSGDPVVLRLVVKGPDAVHLRENRAFTLEFRLPVPTTLEPGKSLRFPIQSLSFGFRGMAEQAQWLQPGDYTIEAHFETALNPAPKGSKLAEDGFGRVTLRSAPVKVKVTE